MYVQIFVLFFVRLIFWTDRYSWWILKQHQLMIILLAAETLFIWFFQVFVKITRVLEWKMTPSHPIFKPNSSLLSLRCDAKDLHSLLSIHITNIGTHMHYSQQNQFVVRAKIKCVCETQIIISVIHSLQNAIYSQTSALMPNSLVTLKNLLQIVIASQTPAPMLTPFVTLLKLFVVKLKFTVHEC